jgi:hypothetical protein
MLGPALSVFGGRALFGPEFHFYTWEVPRNWIRLDTGTFVRLLTFFGRWYAVPLAAAVYFCLRRAPTNGRRWNAWQFLLPFAILTAVLGAMDPDSSDNVFIPLGTWAVLAGTMGLHAYSTRSGRALGSQFARLALLVSFAALAYDPRNVLTSPRAGEKSAELMRLIRTLPGSTCAPDLGQLPGGPRLHPAAHWIALDDLMRARAQDSLTVEAVLAPAIHPPGKAWLLTYRRLNSYSCLRSLRPCYALDTDLGDRFMALEFQPRRFRLGWPRFLYRYDPAAVAARTQPDPGHADPGRSRTLRSEPRRRI